MATNRIGKGTQNVPINMPREYWDALSEAAKQQGVSRNAYCAAVLQDALKHGLTVTVETKVNRPGDGSFGKQKKTAS